MNGYELLGTGWSWLTSAIGHFVILVGAYKAVRRHLDMAKLGEESERAFQVAKERPR
jgi:hypothetical protein